MSGRPVVLLVGWLLAAAALAAGKVRPVDAPVAAPKLAPKARVASEMTFSAEQSGHAGTACASCHVTADWKQVKFDHAKTGFPLKGMHASVSCRACHAASFKTPVPIGCAGCHEDPHAGELGAMCQGCHEEKSWASRFDADAHRLTAFPLIGAHAALPCEECHERASGRRFARAAADCNSCHARDYERTAATALDHAKLGFGLDCQQCHMAWAFKPARLPDHDKCFVISQGSHAAFSCETCHATIPTVTVFGACNSGTAQCINCHSHECARSDPQHVNKGVLGYQCRDRKCAECHRERAP